VNDASAALGRARDALARARSVCVLTGAGVSAESGLPTFRGVDGLWRTHRVEELASPDGFARDARLVWTWYDERRAAHARAVPNAGHLALASIERRFADFTVATQNVDSLHLRAGSRNVLELHGHLREARCDRCGTRRALSGPLAGTDIDHACEGGGRFRPDIVWFGEALPQATWERALAAAARADVVIVAGTSGMVNPAALLGTRVPRRDATVIEINPEATVVSARADIILRGTAGRMLSALDETDAASGVSSGSP
jgi:NAD-dependent deacetylase